MPAKRLSVSASQVHLPCSQRACQEAAGRNIANPPCSSFCRNCRCLSLLHHIFVVQLLALASLNCHLVPQLPVGTVHLVARLSLLFLAQVPALASSLLPPGATLLNKTCVLFFITVFRSLSFLIPH